MKETNHLEIRGMHCAACATRIEKAVSKIDGVEEIHVNLTTEKGRVTFSNTKININEIIKKINTIGFDAEIDRKNNLQSEMEKHRAITVLKWQFFVSALLTFPLAWAMFSHFSWASFITVPEVFINPLFQFAITIPIQFIIGYQFYERAWKSLKSGSANMDVLVILSTSAAFFYSHYLTFTHLNTLERPHSIVLFYETSAFIITFILLGKLLEARTKMRTTEAIKKLYQLQAKTVTLYLNGKESQSPVYKLSPGNVIIVKSGEKVPIDGQVIEGNSMIDESLLTGESAAIEKGIGHHVYAGTINQNGTLKIKVTKRDSETTLSQIIRIVEEAQSSKAPIQHIADKVTGIFVPIIIVISMLTFVLWYVMIQPGQLSEALEKVIAVLIIACPCALGLATPTSVMVGSGRAAQTGILFKEGKYLEVLGKSNVVILDKTGTITKGEPQVTDMYVESFSESDFFEMIGAVEGASGHPVAKAIVKESKKRVFHFPSASEVLTIPGYGIKAFVKGKEVLISNPSYFIKNKLYVPSRADKEIKRFEQEGKTVMLVAINARFAGIIAVADEVKQSSKSAITRLKQMGMDVIMLTGDNEKIALSIAKKTGIEKVQANITPQKKAEIIQSFQDEGKHVVMVGDGINDAPALTVADVGIAMGTGSDIAIESGDITVIKGDLSKVVDAIKISKATMTNIRKNFVWAFLYNMISIPFAMFGLLAPWLAGAVMAFSSVSVVLNSLRLQKTRI
ncbi:heavy metal translocating P-type ATPase [Cytobacillus solani]|uniref:heavy metal translocating P-type ATPase n=1 Tax=Cytobacillus solani TaxID=1637975 RepID=UPI00207A9FFB|nr:heavy metal translocating P-type ATPase [Cytobacillus solani]USK56185.1 heavy metal translocating P-type ATPase [Cytobacillus solani]